MIAERPRIAVVGGGITGLVTAWCLSRDSTESESTPYDVTLFEASPAVGGKIITHRAEGFVVEGGPDAFLAQKQHGVDLCRELGLESSLITPNPDAQRAFVSHGTRLYPVPLGMLGPARWTDVLTSPLMSPAGRMRALFEPFVRPAPEGAEVDESIADFATRRFGVEAYQKVLEPLLCGIHAGDGVGLSAPAVVPHWYALERNHGSVSRGARAEKRTASSPPRTGFVSLSGGMDQLTEHLVSAMPTVTIRSGVEVREIDRGPLGYQVRTTQGQQTFDTVVLSTPAYATARIVPRLDAGLARVLREIPHASTSTVSLTYDAAAVRRKLAGSGYVVPRGEQRAALGCTWSSRKWSGRAPDGQILIRVYLGRVGDDVEARSDAELITLARDELARTIHVTALPRHTFVFRFDRAMPQYTIGHLDRLRRIDAALERHPGLVLAGCSYRGVGIPDCIASARRAAQAATAFVAGVSAG